MRNNRRVFQIVFPSFVLALQTMCALASGREGEAYVGPVWWTVAIVLVTFATSVFVGGLLGAFKAKQSGKSILKNSARGLLRGLLAFLVIVVASVVGLTVLGILWIAYSFLDVYVLGSQ